METDPGPSANGGGANDDARSLTGRLVSGGTRRAQQVAGLTGIDRAVEEAIEDAIVRAIESDATERAVGRILNGPMVEQAVQEALRSEAVEKALLDALDSDLVDRVWARMLESNETELLIKRIAEAPEVRNAIASQGVGLIDDLGHQVREVTRVLDGLAQSLVRRLLFRKPVERVTDRVGAATRLLALALDAAIINVSLLAISAGISLLLNVFNVSSTDTITPALALGATTWFVVSSLYLFTFWSLSGQTPGMRFLDIRIEVDGSRHIGARHARRRLIGFWLATIPFMLGFIGVLSREDRRGFHDRLGNTGVFYIDPGKPEAPHEFANTTETGHSVYGYNG